MQKRFNPDCNTFDEIVEYYKKRAIQLLRFGYKLDSILEEKWGACAIFTNEKTYMYVSPYIVPSFRGQGIYRECMKKYQHLQVITSNDCGIENFLKAKNISFVSVDLKDDYYELISNYYGDRKAERSGVDYMNHIDEGLFVLKELGLNLYAHREIFAAYAYHPILQMDDDLHENTTKFSINHLQSCIRDMSKEAIIYTMEYRSVANEYLSKRKINSIDEIRLSPLRSVNWMLMADKIQNRKDFELYHEGKHPRSNELAQYFRNWLQRLKINEEHYQRIKEKMIINPNIIRL